MEPLRGDQLLIMANDLTDDQIYDAVARLLVSWATCFAALGPSGEVRDRARKQIAELIREEQGK